MTQVVTDRYPANIFFNLKRFISAITTKFKELNTKRRSKQKLIRLKQQISVIKYTTAF
jgi:hypothetical protein